MKIVRYLVLLLLHMIVTSHVIRSGSGIHVFEPAGAAEQPCCGDNDRSASSEKLVSHEACDVEELTSAVNFDKRHTYRVVATLSRDYSSSFFSSSLKSLGDFTSRPFKPPQFVSF